MASASLDMAEQNVAEQRKLIAEQSKCAAEQSTLMAEAANLARDRALTPWQIVAASMAAGTALFGASIAFVTLFLP